MLPHDGVGSEMQPMMLRQRFPKSHFAAGAGHGFDILSLGLLRFAATNYFAKPFHWLHAGRSRRSIKYRLRVQRLAVATPDQIFKSSGGVTE